MTVIYNRKQVNFRSVTDLNELILYNLADFPRDLTLVVAVPRSGYIVAGLIALNLNLPMCSYNEYITKCVPMGGRRAQNLKQSNHLNQKVLIVDDSVSSGWEMRRIKDELSKIQTEDELIFLAAYVSEKAKSLVDIALEITNPPQIFEWNLYHHPHLINSCVDIDGVLCRDATKEEDDDGINYLNFIENVSPRVIPTVEIGWLVTSRLEKYRKPTEEWLQYHGIKYKNLIMQNLPDLKVRQQGIDAKFKAGIFSKLDAIFFVESSSWQSEVIAKNSGKAVFCVDNRCFIPAKTVEGKSWDAVRKISDTINKASKKLL